jgi:hypothetical protein
MVAMILLTAKEPVSAGSRPFARAGAPSMRSAQIVLDREQRQLIESEAMSSERCDYADETKRKDRQQIVMRCTGRRRVSPGYRKFISHRHVMTLRQRLIVRTQTTCAVVKGRPRFAHSDRVCLEAPAQTRIAVNASRSSQSAALHRGRMLNGTHDHRPSATACASQALRQNRKTAASLVPLQPSITLRGVEPRIRSRSLKREK